MRDINGVEMIPTGLVTCFINEEEVRILELSPEAMIIRLADPVESIRTLQVNFFHFKESRYEEISIHSYELQEKEKREYYWVYLIEIHERDYERNAGAVIRDYAEYITLKTCGDDGYCSEEKVGYPANEDETFADNFMQQKKEWFQNQNGGDSQIWTSDYELAVGMDNRVRYQQYLQLGIQEYQAALLQENYLDNHPLCQKTAQRIYVGNQFCHNLFPKEDQLLAIMQKAYEEQSAITVVTTYLREERIPQTEHTISLIYDWCRQHQTRIELVINDWGMLPILHEKTDWIEPVLGILLNKRRKDPRYTYKSGFGKYQKLLAQNSLNGVEYRKFLSETMGITRYEYESCGYPVELCGNRNSLHIPYYQTNTSQYCTLYAKCVYKDRGTQELVRSCPYYCEEIIFSYPKHLKMVGRYNSLFGLDDQIVRDGQLLQSYLEHGADRIVLTLL